MHHLRSSRVRRAFVWSCVPYLLVALFADFLHAHPLLSPDAPAIGIVQHLPSAAAPRATGTRTPRAPSARCSGSARACRRRPPGQPSRSRLRRWWSPSTRPSPRARFHTPPPSAVPRGLSSPRPGFSGRSGGASSRRHRRSEVRLTRSSLPVSAVRACAAASPALGSVWQRRIYGSVQAAGVHAPAIDSRNTSRPGGAVGRPRRAGERAEPPTVPPVARVSMSDAVRLAVERNQSLRAQRLTIDQAEGGRDDRGAQAESIAGARSRRVHAVFAAPDHFRLPRATRSPTPAR